MSLTNIYHGSCHCGSIKYQIRLAFPINPTTDRKAETVRIYKCNCTTCQKMGYFHVRPANAVEDFVVTSPASIDELGDYRVFHKRIGWYFCKHCGVRVFGVGGKWEQVELDLGKWAGREADGKTQKVWRSREMEWARLVDGEEVKSMVHYVSVNAVTLDQGQENIDLIEWHKKGWIFYVDNYNEPEGEMRFGEPHPNGMF